LVQVFVRGLIIFSIRTSVAPPWLNVEEAARQGTYSNLIRQKGERACQEAKKARVFLQSMCEKSKRNALMTQNTSSDTLLATDQPTQDDLQRCLLDVSTPATSRALLKRKRGRPLQLTWSHLALGLLLCLLRGWESQLDLWRMIRFEGVGILPCLPITDQAVYKRLAQVGQQAMHACFVQGTLWLPRTTPSDNWSRSGCFRA
jgi:hypothetical protein